MSDVKREEVVLASVLHDIGKLFQRCRDKRYEMEEETHASLYCPYIKEGNYFGYRHVLSTYRFIHENRDVFPERLNAELIASLAAKHHIPDSPVQSIIQEADHISAGHDRRFEEDENAPDVKNYYKQPLKSIFSSVVLFDRKPSEPNYYGLSPLSRIEEIFPKKEFSALSPDDYRNTADKFERDFKKLQGLPYKQFIYALDSLLKEYTWAIPASTNSAPDISLYDHLRTTAGFAAVLFQYHHNHNNIDKTEEIKNKEKEKFLLVGGDLSGIQQYIFNLETTTFNAKILRARSFELQLISESVCRSILEGLQLPLFCKLMDAGGRFLTVLPNLPATEKLLHEIRIQTETAFLENYFGELTLNISTGLPVSSEQLKQEKAREVFRHLSVDIAEAKSRKLQQGLRERGHVLGTHYNKISGNENICPVCHKRPVEKTLTHIEAEHQLCSSCYHLVRLGQQIPKTDYLIFTEKDSSVSIKGCEHPLPTGGKVILADAIAEQKEIYSLIFSVNELKPGLGMMSLPFFLPKDENTGEIFTFEDLAGMSEGTGKVAMMKADVDNLGHIFSESLGDSFSVSRYATLSRMLDFFFSAYLNHKIRSEWQTIYTVFSGGDDLCVVGPWKDLILFGRDLQNDFLKFTGENPNLTISAGTVLAAPHLPVRTIADTAEEALETSKDTEGKNRSTIFGIPAAWNSISPLIEFGDELVSYVRQEKITKGVLYRLLLYGRSEKELKKGNVAEKHALWRSHFYYDIARNGKNLHEQKEDLQEKVEKNINELEIPVEYALYSLRENRLSHSIKEEKNG